jgi:hypothetical protein
MLLQSVGSIGRLVVVVSYGCAALLHTRDIILSTDGMS